MKNRDFSRLRISGYPTLAIAFFFISLERKTPHFRSGLQAINPIVY